MKQTAIILMVLGTFITGNPSARADSGNPFGFETNKHPLEYEYCKKERPYWYECSSAPRMHPDIEKYILHFVEDVGLCVIGAYSYRDSPENMKNMVEKFREQITQKYGSPTQKSEEDSAYYWDQKGGFKDGDIDAISLKKPLVEGSLQFLQVQRLLNQGFKVYHDLQDAGIDPEQRFPGITAKIQSLQQNMANMKAQIEQNVNIVFSLVTLDTCRKKINEKANRAF